MTERPPVIVVGECNPYGRDPRYALYDEPENSAGGRLRRLVFGLRRTSYHRYTRRLNLCTGKWSAAAARCAAAEILCERLDGRTYVLLGRGVACAFDLGAHAPFSCVRVDDPDGCLWPCVLLPHPSGRNRAWNEPGAIERARALLRAARPDVPWGEVDRPEPEPAPAPRCANCGQPAAGPYDCADCGEPT